MCGGHEGADDHVDDGQQPAAAKCCCSVCHGNLLVLKKGWYPGLRGGKPGYRRRAFRPRSVCAARLEPAVVADDVAAPRTLVGVAARPAAVRVARRVKAQTGDHRVGMTTVRVDRDPAAATARAPALEVTRRHRLREQPGAVQRVGNGARAVVARVLPLPVAAAVLVRLADDPVGSGDRVDYLL